MSSTRALVQKMHAALESCGQGHITDGGKQWFDEKLVDAALADAEAYLLTPEPKPSTDRIPLRGDPGALLVRNGHGNWEVHRDGKCVRRLSAVERLFIDSALDAARRQQHN